MRGGEGVFVRRRTGLLLIIIIASLEAGDDLGNKFSYVIQGGSFVHSTCFPILGHLGHLDDVYLRAVREIFENKGFPFRLRRV